MEPIDIIIIVLAIGVVVGTIAYSIVRKKKGKSACGCECTSCSSCPHCSSKTKTSDDEPKQ